MFSVWYFNTNWYFKWYKIRWWQLAPFIISELLLELFTLRALVLHIFGV